MKRTLIMIAALIVIAGCESGKRPDAGGTPCDGIKNLCDAGFECVNSACVAINSSGCYYDVECQDGQVCKDHKCVEATVLECTTFADCKEGENCMDYKCVDPDTECKKDSDCEANEKCTDGKCVDKAPDSSQSTLTITDSTVTIECGSDKALDNYIGLAKCPSGTCLVSTDQPLPDGLKLKTENGKISVFSDEQMDLAKCAALKAQKFETNATACDSVILTNCSIPQKFGIKGKFTGLSIKAEFPGGVLKTAYGPVKLAAEGGSKSFSWKAENLPPGLVLTLDTISGTPTALGEFESIVTVIDNLTKDEETKKFTLSVTDEFSFDLYVNEQIVSNNKEISVPFDGKLTLKIIGKSDKYDTQVFVNGKYSHARTVTMGSGGKIELKKEDFNLKANEAMASKVTIRVLAYDGAVVKKEFDSITFGGSPCDLKIAIEDEASIPTETTIGKANPLASRQLHIENGPQNAKYIWKTTHSASTVIGTTTVTSEDSDHPIKVENSPTSEYFVGCFTNSSDPDDIKKNAGVTCDLTGKFIYSFSKAFSDKTAGKSIVIKDTMTITAALEGASCQPASKKISINVNIPSPHDPDKKANSKLSAKIKIEYYNGDGDDWFDIRLFNNEDLSDMAGLTAIQKLNNKNKGAKDLLLPIYNALLENTADTDNAYSGVLNDLKTIQFRVKGNVIKYHYFAFHYIILVSETHYLYLFNGWDVELYKDKIGDSVDSVREYKIGEKDTDGNPLMWKLRCDQPDEDDTCGAEIQD